MNTRRDECRKRALDEMTERVLRGREAGAGNAIQVGTRTARAMYSLTVPNDESDPRAYLAARMAEIFAQEEAATD